MQLRKWAVALAAVAVAGFALGVPRAAHAAAPSISKVEIISPDSGHVVGIDSVIVAKATLQVVSPTANQGVVFYLISKGNKKRVVTDGSASQKIDNKSGTATAEEDVIGAANATNAKALTVAFSSAASFSSLSGKGIVAAQQYFGASGAAVRGTSAALTKSTDGDGDSIVVNTSGSLPTFTWYLPLSAEVRTMDSVEVAAFAFDKSASATGSVVASAASHQIGLDGDRPDDSNLKIVSLTNADAFENQDVNSDGTYALGTYQQGGCSSCGGTDNHVLFKVNKGPASISNGSTPILGIGDSLRVRVDLGSSDVPIIFGDSLSVEMKLKGKRFTIDKTDRATNSAVLRRQVAIKEGTFGDIELGLDKASSSHASSAATISVFVVDAAGNRSGYNPTAYAGKDDASEGGVTAIANFLVDAKAPVLDNQTAKGDTVLPVSNDTITDGSYGNFASSYESVAGSGTAPAWLKNYDINQLRYTLAEPLDSLFITLDGSATDAKITINNATHDTTNASLLKTAGKTSTNSGKDSVRFVDFTAIGTDSSGATYATSHRQIFTRKADGSTATSFTLNHGGGGKFDITKIITGVGSADTLLKTGMYTVKLQGRDLGGNLGSVLTRTNVYIDVDTLGYDRLFPTASAGLDSIEKETAKVVFRLTEPADSVQITYFGISGTDKDSTRTRKLVGSELTNSTSEQTFSVGGLRTGTDYTLLVSGRDVAGNFSQVNAGTLTYDTTYVVPIIAKFSINPKAAADSSLVGYGHPASAGSKVNLTVKALTVDSRTAVTYKQQAVLRVSGGSGVAISGTGVTDEGNGRALLSADEWVIGSRTVTLLDTTTIDTLTVAVADSSDTTDLYVGSMDSVVVVNPAAYSQLEVSAPDTVGQGDNFWVDVSIADKYGNVRTTDNRFVEVSTPSLGVQYPNTAIGITKGAGGFWANSQGFSGDLTLTVRDVADSSSSTTAKSHSFYASATVHVDGDGSTVLDDPDTLMAQDYMGANGTGDQGGFVLLTFPVSADHATLTGYRIYRELTVDYDADSTGALVALAEPTKKMVPWGLVDPVPGQSVMRVVVATLDGDSTRYGVAAERGQLSTKEAFDSAADVSSPYELMAETMQQSKAAAQIDADAPVFATLTPEALAFSEKGVVPRLKSTGDVLVSNVRASNPVRAIDNLPPAAVSYVQAQDTPNDIGGSITVKWAKSADDKMLSYTVPNAIGDATTYTTAGVDGYNVYRKLGDSAWQMVGQTGAGETSFEDATAFNGVRYDYKVEARDADNVTDSKVESQAMAFRNNVVDANGQRIYGLYGADATVDLDDFFIFADHFGMSAGDQGFDKAFDLAPNNLVDLSDFFVFADNFGKQMAGAAKVVPTMAGLNSDARFNLDAGSDLPKVGDEFNVAVSLDNVVDLRGYGLTVEYDSNLLEFVEPQVTDNALGQSDMATPQILSQSDGKVTLGALGQTTDQGDLGLNLVFRTKQEVESSYIEVTSGELQDGTYGLNQITSPVSVRIETRPEVYALADNYPNPFNPETTIKYQLPESGQVRLEVYNMLGQVVKTLVDNQFQKAGRYTYQWDATDNSGKPLSSGVYFYRIVAGGKFQSHKKMLLLK